jgi:hypothetical protein
VNWNQKNCCWAELKGQAKRQSRASGNELYKLTDVEKISHERESLASIMTIKARSERQLSELQDLLQIMGSFQNGISSMIYQNNTSPDKKLSIPIYVGLTGFEI